MTCTRITDNWCCPSEQVKGYAAAKGIDYLTLVERIMWRQWCSHLDQLTAVMTEAADNILWDQAHEEAVKRQHYVGEKYDPDTWLDITDIAKRVRADIKQQFPDVEATVRTDRYAGGRSLTVTVRQAPFPLYRRAGEYRTYTDEAIALQEGLRRLVNAYNYDQGDCWTDYYCQNFCERIDLLDGGEQ